MSPQYAGMPKDTRNYRKLPCGCELVRVALPGNPEVYSRKCAAHGEGLPQGDTHAEWCRHLSALGKNLLDPSHVMCKTNDRCMSAAAREIRAKMRAEGKIS